MVIPSALNGNYVTKALHIAAFAYYSAWKQEFYLKQASDSREISDKYAFIVLVIFRLYKTNLVITIITCMAVASLGRLSS
jgi:hypothetical protein